MKVKSVFVVIVHKERSKYRAALEAFDTREGAEESVRKQLMQGGVTAWVEEIPFNFGGDK